MGEEKGEVAVATEVERKVSNVSDAGDIVTVRQLSDAFEAPNAKQAPRRTERVARAKQRASIQAQAEGIFFSGKSAIDEVAKPDGSWNWVLIGPDKSLPLSGGGSGGAEEMREALGVHAHCFGVLRMGFGVGHGALVKWLFIHASDDHNPRFSAVQRGRDMMKEPEIHAQVAKMVQISTTAIITKKADCSAEFMIDALQKVVTGFDGGMVTMDNFKAAAAEEEEKNKETREAEKKRAENIQVLMQQVEPPAAKVEEITRENTTTEDGTLSTGTLRKKVKLYSKGDQVEIYSSSQETWILDAEVVDVARDSCTVDGVAVRAGSMKVVYSFGKRFKWVAPQQMEELIRASPRPRPPEPKVGDMEQETYSWWSTYWKPVYVELDKGFLQWWNSKEEASKGQKPAQAVFLLGLQQEHAPAAVSFKLRSDGTQGNFFNFKCETPEECERWMGDLWAQADYCNETTDFYVAKMGGTQVRSELLTVMKAKKSYHQNLAVKGRAAEDIQNFIRK